MPSAPAGGCVEAGVVNSGEGELFVTGGGGGGTTVTLLGLFSVGGAAGNADEVETDDVVLVDMAVAPRWSRLPKPIQTATATATIATVAVPMSRPRRDEWACTGELSSELVCICGATVGALSVVAAAAAIAAPVPDSPVAARRSATNSEHD